MKLAQSWSYLYGDHPRTFAWNMRKANMRKSRRVRCFQDVIETLPIRQTPPPYYGARFVETTLTVVEARPDLVETAPDLVEPVPTLVKTRPRSGRTAPREQAGTIPIETMRYVGRLTSSWVAGRFLPNSGQLRSNLPKCGCTPENPAQAPGGTQGSPVHDFRTLPLPQCCERSVMSFPIPSPSVDFRRRPLYLDTGSANWRFPCHARTWAHTGRNSLNYGRDRPNSPRIQQNLAPTLVEVGPNSTRSGRNWPEIGRRWPECAQIWP